MSRGVLVNGTVSPEEYTRAEQLAKSLFLKVPDLVTFGLSKACDEIEKTGQLIIKQREPEEKEPAPRPRRRGHALFDN